MPYLKNRNFAVEMTESGSVCALESDASSFRAVPGTELFRMRLRGITGMVFEVGPSDFAAPEFCPGENPEKWDIRFGGCSRFPGLKVSVSLRLDSNQSASFWSLHYQALPDDLLLEWLDFPRITLDFPLRGNGGTGICFLPIHEGGVYDRLDQRRHSPFPAEMVEYPLSGVNGYYPGPCPMQFLALYTPEAGLYFAAHDPSGTPKGIDVFAGTKHELRPMFQHFCGEHGMDYEVCIAGFQGDWHAAAELYRNWIQENPAELPPRLEENRDIPDWLTDSPLVLIYPVRGTGLDSGCLAANEYFPYLNALPWIRQYHELWDSRIMALLMHWEGTAPWAPPYLWPPYGGADLLKAFSTALHENGDLLGLYGSGIAWTLRSSIIPEYSSEQQFNQERLESEMSLGPRREMYSRICNGRPGQSQRVGYDLCPSRKFTRDIVVGELRSAAQAEVDYLQYFDQNQGASAPLCYSRNHGHFPMPEKWLTRAMSDLLAAAKETALAQPRRTIIGCENAAAEPYLRYLPFNDLRNHLVWRAGGIPVPAYNFVFHEYGHNFTGNGVCLNDWIDKEKTPELLQFLVGSGIVRGDVISFVLRDGGNFHWSWCCDWRSPAPDTGPAATLAGNLNAWRKPGGHAHDPLIYGRMETPPQLECGTWKLYFNFDRPPAELPSVLSSAWSHHGKHWVWLVNFHAGREHVQIDFAKPVSGKHFASPHDPHPRPFHARKWSIDLPPLQGCLIEYKF